ncbi:hypothetical protein [Fibrobacter sp.]|uniref:hypothetical protein n=1 Tax=Fibrobacter sp. TaxID=35828 RepID=UPI0025B94B3D|nr:hypothetical protein [Fibrobacter sp.]
MEEEGILKAWKKKTLMNVTTITAKSRASTQPSVVLRPRLFCAIFSNHALSRRLAVNSKTTGRPRSHHQFPCHAIHAT